MRMCFVSWLFGWRSCCCHWHIQSWSPLQSRSFFFVWNERNAHAKVNTKVDPNHTAPDDNPAIINDGRPAAKNTHRIMEKSAQEKYSRIHKRIQSSRQSTSTSVIAWQRYFNQHRLFGFRLLRRFFCVRLFAEVCAFLIRRSCFLARFRYKSTNVIHLRNSFFCVWHFQSVYCNEYFPRLCVCFFGRFRVKTSLVKLCFFLHRFVLFWFSFQERHWIRYHLGIMAVAFFSFASNQMLIKVFHLLHQKNGQSII